MENDMLERIRTSKRTCYFVSPHLDDMVFSASALATELAKTNRIVVVNVFTDTPTGPNTRSAAAYLKQCGYNDAEALYQNRRDEDVRALAGLADEIINLAMTEALWRRKPGRLASLIARLLPELAALYPTYRWHIIKAKLSRHDRQTVDLIRQKLGEVIGSDAFVFCPLGVGNHIDHVITSAACDAMFDSPIHWVDFPYSARGDSKSTTGLEGFSFNGDSQEKLSRMQKYETQYSTIFPNGAVLQPEEYFVRTA